MYVLPRAGTSLFLILSKHPWFPVRSVPDTLLFALVCAVLVRCLYWERQALSPTLASLLGNLLGDVEDSN